MRTLFIPFLVFAIHSFAQVDSGKLKNNALSFDSTCYRLWWVDNKMGGYDGYEFRSNGELKLMNYDAFLGEKWWIEGNHLFAEIRSKRDGKILKTDYLIKQQTEKLLVLDYTVFGDLYTDKYELIINNDFTDKLLGYWEGTGESYIQIIPINSFQFQLVVSPDNKSEVIKYLGDLDEENQTIGFEIDGMETKLGYATIDGVMEISLNNKVYRRSCSK
jgi:hypothetical protein